MPSFSAGERRILAAAVGEDGPLSCPACGGEVRGQPVARPDGVAYVRRRVWLLCGTCKRSAAVDLPTDD